jgi:mannose-6-phosphate isomerase-like protein (cupin superfamily)
MPLLTELSYDKKKQEEDMSLETIRVTRDEMAKRVAFFKDLKGFDGGLPDSRHPECERTLYNVIGFQPPEGADPRTVSPVGAHAAEASAIKISEGFNLGYCEAAVGNGPMMHNHDTNETFIPMTGRWRCSWEVDGKVEHFDVGPYDVVSFPPGVQRRFQNVTYSEPDKKHLLMFVIGGNAPKAEFSPESMAELRERGLVTD